MIGERFSDIVDAIYAAAVDQHQWSAAMELIAAEVGGRGTLIGINARTAPKFFSVTGYDQTEIDSFTADYASRSFVWALLPAAAEGTLIHDRRVLSDDRRRLDIFANEWAPRSDTSDCAVMPLIKRPEVSAVAVIARSISGGDFDQSAILFLEKLIPHLRRAITVNSRLGHAAHQAGFALETIERLLEPLIMVSEDGQMTWCNQAAETLLQDKESGLSLFHGRIICNAPQHSASLGRLIGAAAGKQNGMERTAGAMLIEREGQRRPIALYCLPLAHPQRWTLEKQPAALLLLADTARNVEPSATMLSRLFQLTSAEARLAACLGQGHTLAEAATELNVARSTVASHLHAIFQKTQTRRQSDLVRLLHSLPRLETVAGNDAG